jgi:hypothetical protein
MKPEVERRATGIAVNQALHPTTAGAIMSRRG